MEACNYGEMRDDMLRDHLVVSVTSTTMTYPYSGVRLDYTCLSYTVSTITLVTGVGLEELEIDPL